MIDIKDISGSIRFSTIVNEGSKRKFLLMKEDYVTVKFNLDEPIFFKLGDYIDDGHLGVFEICDIQKPAYNAITASYDYELRLDAYYWKWKNKIFKYTPETAGQEASWNLTAPLDVQVGIVLRNLKALGYTYKGQDFVFSIDSTVENKAQLMSYDNINILDACFEMAKKWDCECWVTENIIHFGRCEFGTAVDFEIAKNVVEMTRSESQSTYATRIYAFGSTRNIPTNYRPIDETVVVNGVVQKRLMLPEGIPYIDAYPNMTTEEAIEQVVIFDEVYPRRVGTMSDITTKEYTETIENADGTITEKKWNAYRFKDTGITFSKDYVLPSEELKITFQSGKLNGMMFAVTFDPDGKDEQLWEIVRNEDYGRPLPDGVLVPENGGTYVLSGWDSTKITELGLVSSAEQELKAETEKYVAKSKIDPNTYNCKMMSDDAYREDSIHNLYGIGQKVNLISKAYFENGRQSRIIGFEFNLDYPFDSPVYTVGETAAYSRISELEEKIENITLAGQTYTGGGGSGVYLIRRNDSTPATDSNAFSALRSLETFLRKDQTDFTNYLLKLLAGLEVGKYSPGFLGTGASIDEKGYAEMTGLTLREFLEAPEYRFNRIDVVSGELWNARAFGLIESVDTVSQIVTLKLEENELSGIHLNDFCRGIFHNLNSTSETIDSCGFKTLAGFSTSYFTPVELLDDGKRFRYVLKSGTTVHPCKAMKFAVYGNPKDKSRQASAYSTRTYKRYLTGVNTWEIDPERNIAMQFGDCSGLSISGEDLSGYSAYLNNVYITGIIKWLEDHKEEFKGKDGKDGYSVSLSSYDAVIAVNSDGEIDNSIYEIVNIVSGKEKVISGGMGIVTTKYKVQTSIQAIHGNTVLQYSETIGTGKYVAGIIPKGCEYALSDGVITITKITEDKATLDIEINCEGMASFTKTFTLTRVYGERGFTGADGKDIEFIFLRSATDTVPAPVSEDRDDFVPPGWTDNPLGVTSTYIYELVSRRVKANGVWSAFSTPAPWSRYAQDGVSPYYINLTNDSATVPADNNGRVTDYSLAHTKVQLYVGQTLTESAFEISEVTQGVTFVLSGDELRVTGIPTTTDSVRLLVCAKVNDAVVASITFTVSKARAGADGQPVTIHYLQLPLDVIRRSQDGSVDVSRIHIKALQKTGNLLPEDSVGTSVRFKRSDDSMWTTGNAVTITVNTAYVDIELLDLASGTLLDSERIPVVEDGADGNDGPGYEIIFCQQKENITPGTPDSRNQDKYVPDGWTDDQQGTSALWPYEFSSSRRKTDGSWGAFSIPKLWANYSYDGDDAYSVSLSSYDAVVAVNGDGELDTSLYDMTNVVSGEEKVYTSDKRVVTGRYQVQTEIFAFHGADRLEYSDTAMTGKYSVSITASSCEYTIANGVITVTKISADKATLDIVVNCEGKITVPQTFNVTRIRNGADANLLPWIEEWNSNKTEIAGEYVVSPKMFSGIRDEVTGKLTGVAFGRDCITIDGVKHTGIFGIVDNEIVFTLDPLSRKYIFKGRVEADNGTIAGLNIEGTGLTNKGFNNDAYIVFRNDLVKTFAGIGSNLLPATMGGVSTVARFENNRVGKDQMDPENIAIVAGASGSNSDNIALMVVSGRMDVPGLLRGMRVEVVDNNITVPYKYGKWDGTGYSISYKDGSFTVQHNLGHTRYYVTGSVCSTNYAKRFASFHSFTADSFKVSIFDTSGNVEQGPGFSFSMCGDNR